MRLGRLSYPGGEALRNNRNRIKSGSAVEVSGGQWFTWLVEFQAASMVLAAVARWCSTSDLNFSLFALISAILVVISSPCQCQYWPSVSTYCETPGCSCLSFSPSSQSSPELRSVSQYRRAAAVNSQCCHYQSRGGAQLTWMSAVLL